MNKYTFESNGFTFERVPKNKARVAFRNGLTVIFCPVKLRPGTIWHCEATINKNYVDGETFDRVLNEFEYYNCTNPETGYYTAFYIPIRYVNRFSGEPCERADFKARREYDYRFMEV